MQSEKTIGWLQIGGNIGVLVGLILVAIQINQNSNLVRHQLINDQFAIFVSKQNTLMGENPAKVWAKSVESPEDLTLEEMFIMESYFYRTMNEYYYFFDNQDFYGDEWRQRVVWEYGWFLRSPLGRAWWANQRETMPAKYDELRDLLDQLLKEGRGEQTDHFQSIRDRLSDR